VSDSSDSADNYEKIYRHFDSALMQKVRREAYGDDIGQHSWVVADELRQDISRLQLSATSSLLDLGCGPCGPLVVVVEATRCRATGLEMSAAALEAGAARARAHGVLSQVQLQRCDLNDPLPCANGSFDAAMSLDVVPHLRDRAAAFREVARVLSPSGRFLITDAAVLTGTVSSEQLRLRSGSGAMQFVAPGFNELCLEQAGLRLLETQDRTPSVFRNASGRLSARKAHRQELERVEGSDEFARQQKYLETVAALAEGRALSRIMFLSEVGTA
jgi:SAM-dependent methyltransferase